MVGGLSHLAGLLERLRFVTELRPITGVDVAGEKSWFGQPEKVVLGLQLRNETAGYHLNRRRRETTKSVVRSQQARSVSFRNQNFYLYTEKTNSTT